MGKQNRERRAAKKRKRSAGDGGRTTASSTRPGERGPGGFGGAGGFGGHGGFGGPSGGNVFADAFSQRVPILELIEDAIEAALGGDPQGVLDGLLDRLERSAAEVPSGRVVEAVAEALAADLHDTWHRGWQPADALGAIGRRLDRAAVQVTALTIADEARALDPDLAMPPRWARQLDAVAGHTAPLAKRGCATATDFVSGAAATDGTGTEARRAAIRTAIFVAAVLRTFPPLPQLLPDPCAWPRRGGSGGGGDGGRSGAKTDMTLDDGVDDAMHAKVRALLAKAESTTFEAEAMALTAKAQELMTRHAIDRAVLDRERGSDDEPEGRRVRIEDPYATERSVLLVVVASSNRCEAVWSKDLGFATILGFAPDLDTVELLYASLLVQATTIMAGHGSQRDRHGRSSTRSFRQSFLVGFAGRIGERLREANDSTFAQAEADHVGASTGTALVPLFAERTERVDDAVSQAFPAIKTHQVRAGNRAGLAAGRVAAEQASLAMGEAIDR